MPGGWIPGKYNPETRSYHSPFLGKITAKPTNPSVFIIGMYSPFGSPDSIFMKFEQYGEEQKILLHRPWIRYGLIDSTGKVLKPFIYSEIKSASRGCFMLAKDSLAGIYNYLTKEMIVPMKYRRIRYNFSTIYPYYLLQDENNLFGMADSTGRVVVPCQYRYRSENNYYISFSNEKHPDGEYPDVYDYTGKKFFSGEYEYVRTPAPGISFFEGRKNNKDYYFIDVQTMSTQKTDFVPLYRFTSKFDSLILIHGIYSDSIHHKILWNDKSAVYERENNKFTTPDGHEYNPRWGVSDFSGKLLLPLEYDLIDRKSHGLLFVEKDGKQGLLNQNMEWVVPLRNHQIKSLNYLPLIQVSKNNRQGSTYWVDLNGTVILSENIIISHIDDNYDNSCHIIFRIKGENIYYKLIYDKEKEHFFWYRDEVFATKYPYTPPVVNGKTIEYDPHDNPDALFEEYFENGIFSQPQV